MGSCCVCYVSPDFRTVIVANMNVFGKIGLDRQPAIFIGMDLMAGRRIVLNYADASPWLAP